ncbi:SDR family oxidoreductase [Svornostia abyssi]|uniref:SDR family oxidoreductase n=1 Tax=Svornostia abyssi TaxID=2898438 RepID=A0ABY5PLU2_9ACTN|nr:SDR family oxidoreductase [Parviterribacteraceae bacterium J379]
MSLPELFSVRGRTALVTGGSRGVGLMIARGLVQAGAEVIISSRKADACDAAVAELSQFGEASAIPADVSTADGAAALAGAVTERVPELHLLVNNAGATWGAPLGDFPDAAWDRVMDANVRGMFNLTQDLLGPLRAAASAERPARVINIGSVDGLRVPMTENYSYSASKAAVHMLTRHLAKRLAGEHITVNAIAPGPFESKMTAFMLDNEEGRAAVASTVPLGRIGSEDDIVGTTLFLASRAGAYLTGAVIPVDGGMVGCA